ncbi:alpha/beta fold hydrolase [Kribbella sp. DT2]|uniref:alpha/beta fold hydrolase n=1 Tax=Kribbella sp. DT2 TaxID=3393427 RepID=UPI003CE75EF9
MTWTPPKTHELTVDERTIQYCLYGEAGGVPVVSLHGTPGTRWERPDVVAAINDSGLRVLLPGRPGYGSGRRPGRSVADIAYDVQALADAEGWDQFAVTGFSGGAPHALACAALLPERITFCSTVAGIGPLDDLDLDWANDARQGEEHLRKHLAHRGAEVIASLADQPVPAEGALAAAHHSAGAGDDNGRHQRLHASLIDGIDGWIDDDLALIRPWGFDLGAIEAPVSVWYGADDENSSIEHTEWLLANLPGAIGHEYDGGHDPSDVVQRAVFAELSRGRGTDPSATRSRRRGGSSRG